MRGSLVSVILFIAAFSWWCVACSGDNGDAASDGDADIVAEAEETIETVESIDTEKTDEAPTESVTEEDVELTPFYSACADPYTRIQYPHPGWLTADQTSATGYRLNPPTRDAAALLLRDTRESWYAAMADLDGFPLMAVWLVALNSPAAVVDTAHITILRRDVAGGYTAVADFDPTPADATLLDGGSTLLLSLRRPLPPPAHGEQYVLTFYQGALDAGKPLPACGPDGAAQDAYQRVAAELMDSSYRTWAGANLVFALPLTFSRQSLALPALETELEAHPTVVVTSIEKRTLDSFGEYAPDANTAAALQPTAYSGILTLPWYLDADGRMHIDPETLIPAAQGTSTPGFVLVLPATWGAPYPVVVVQHGGGRSPEDLLAIAGPYARNGFALLGIDLPYHNRRAAEDGSGLLKMADFDHPITTANNFRQAAADHLALYAGMDAINDAVSDLGVIASPIRTDYFWYVGHSMGSISGTISSFVSHRVLGIDLLAGGGPFPEVLKGDIYSLLFMDVLDRERPAETDTLLAMTGALLNAGDPLVYPRFFGDRRAEPADVLVFGAPNDPMMPFAANDWQGRIAGASLALPANHEVADIAVATLPLSDNSIPSTQSTRACTRVLVHRTYPDLATSAIHMAVFYDAEAHEATAACFLARSNGLACVVDGL